MSAANSPSAFGNAKLAGRNNRRGQTFAEIAPKARIVYKTRPEDETIQSYAGSVNLAGDKTGCVGASTPSCRPQ